MLGQTGLEDQECIVLMYHYFTMRGFKNLVSIKINNLITTLFVLFVIIFVSTFIDYQILFTSYQLEAAINWHRPISPVLIIYTILFLGYWLWKLTKTIYDLRKFWIIRKYYQNVLHIDSFQLQNTEWDTIQTKIIEYNQYLNPEDIRSLIMKQEILVLTVLRELLHHHPNIPITKIMEWEIGFIISRYFFTRDTFLVDFAGLKKRFQIIGLINIILIPFLFIFAGVYVIFRYGEILYTQSEYLTSREWSKWARYTYLRQPTELPHEFEERCHRAKRYADKYISYFRPHILYNFAQLIIIILSIILMVLVLLSIVNVNFLLRFEFWGKSCFQYISLIVTIMVFLRSYMQRYGKVTCDSQQYFSKMATILNCDIIISKEEHCYTRAVYKEFMTHWYISRIKLVVLEVWGILALPYIFLKILPQQTENMWYSLSDDELL